MKKNILITFEDHGQDFLTWLVTPEGEILACEPFQHSIWSKWKVIAPKKYKAGDSVLIERGAGKNYQTLTIKYPIESVKKVQPDPVKKV